MRELTGKTRSHISLAKLADQLFKDGLMDCLYENLHPNQRLYFVELLSTAIRASPIAGQEFLANDSYNRAFPILRYLCLQAMDSSEILLEVSELFETLIVNKDLKGESILS